MRRPKSPDKPTKREMAEAATREALLARRQRQGEALRANLRRRKAAARPDGDLDATVDTDEQPSESGGKTPVDPR
jgi:hypothetical protein